MILLIGGIAGGIIFLIWLIKVIDEADTAIEDEDGNIIKYINKMDEEKLKNCKGYKYSNCCGEPFLDGTDVCSYCFEHAVPECQDCHLYEECENINKPNIL